MFKRKFVVGGEFVFSPWMILKPDLGQFSDYGSGLVDYYRYYTFGAYYSLKAMIENLKLRKDEYVLLPSYLCPTIIDPFRESGVRYDFYKMKEGLLPDLEDIDRKTTSGLKAILFIDYFGFPQKDHLLRIIEDLRQRKVCIVQDTVQSWINNQRNLYGDFCFNSMRKTSPFEASVILSRLPIKFRSTQKPIRKFIRHKRYAQIIRHYHLKYGLFQPRTFLRHIDIANENYHQPQIVGMPEGNHKMLDKIDFATVGRERKFIYGEILEKLNPKHVLLCHEKDIVPLGLPVYLEDRDKRKDRLHDLDIHCPWHWKLSEEIDPKEHSYSHELEQHELTLPVNVWLPDLNEYIIRLKEVIN